MLKEKIAAKLEQAFSDMGFVEPNVAKLKTACGVSLRTLYKYYPSKEDMIVAALEHRHQRYLKFLSDNAPTAGINATIHIFQRLAVWMETCAPNGCMSANAIAAFPEHEMITKVVKNHKMSVQRFLGEQCSREDLATELFLLHEGVSIAWPIIGAEVTKSALLTVSKLLKEN